MSYIQYADDIVLLDEYIDDLATDMTTTDKDGDTVISNTVTCELPSSPEHDVTKVLQYQNCTYYSFIV